MKKNRKILLKGIGASPGIVKGMVQVIHQPVEATRMKEGKILVVPFTNPLFTLALLKCSALITDEGGIMSHGAIIARELGIPAVVGTKRATSVLKNGQIVLVDGAGGEVYEE